MSTRQKCTATTKSGAPCGAWATGDNGLCISHDPARAARLAAARSAGGRARHGRRIGATGDAQPVALRTLADVLALLTQTANDLLTLENSVSRARAMIALAGAWADCYQTTELENRIAALESRVNA